MLGPPIPSPVTTAVAHDPTDAPPAQRQTLLSPTPNGPGPHLPAQQPHGLRALSQLIRVDHHAQISPDCLAEDHSPFPQ
ncbi:hypothetical protein LIER_42629 [Lithospermum erythrorhizon]|uniref:Uncharacterized protein n=1 Tax=Lithospermum erythrorhizon TaxID=34254 RepID=A0AAV3NST1_LITER